MKKMISIVGVVCALVGSAYAASATVMSFEGGEYVKGSFPPHDWYTFKDGKGADITSSNTATAKTFTATVSLKDQTTAGIGFNWGTKQDSVKDLSAYNGMCLTYSATSPFRLDMKQTNIKDYNYNGFIVPKKSKIDTLFIAFGDMKQEDWGDKTVKVGLDLTKQLGVQFSYKQSIAAETNADINLVKIAAISLGNSCTNAAPALKTGVISPAEETLNEGDTLKVAFKDIFVDADGDDLNIVANIDGYAVDLTGKKSYSLSDVAWVASKPNPKGTNTSATATFTAKDASGASVEYTVNLTLVDQDNAPSAVADSYEVNEDDTLKVTFLKNVKLNDADADGDEFEITGHTDPSNGKLDFDEKDGTFIYVPDANFFGTDEFTYTITDATDMKGVGTVTITVKGVDDPATVVVKDSTFYVGTVDEETAVAFKTGLSVKEDFGTVEVIVPVANVEFSDPDETGVITPAVKSKSGLVDVALALDEDNYVLSVNSVADANGKDSIFIYVGTGTTAASVGIPVTIAAVADPPKAVNDTITVLQDEKNVISAAKGVLANDINPDGKSALKAYLYDVATEGKVTLATDGSFTYEVGDYEGPDAFAYVAVNAEGDTSKPAIVYLNVVYKNKPPVIVAADTVGSKLLTLKEDFSAVTYSNVAVKSWFEDPDGNTAKITYAVESLDTNLITASISSVSVITIKSVKNACGESFVNVIATDSLKASTTLKLPVVVECVNDAPVLTGPITDTVFVPRDGWREVFYIYDVFEDPDDTVLTVSVVKKNQYLAATVEGDTLIVTLAEERLALQDKVAYELRVSATDAAGESSPAKKLIFKVGDKVAIPQMAAAPKASWQKAILANQGVAAMCDMQGRVMWKAKLPVSEDAVRNAAAKVQGRKVLMVNKQTWTIK